MGLKKPGGQGEVRINLQESHSWRRRWAAGSFRWMLAKLENRKAHLNNAFKAEGSAEFLGELDMFLKLVGCRDVINIEADACFLSADLSPWRLTGRVRNSRMGKNCHGECVRAPTISPGSWKSLTFRGQGRSSQDVQATNTEGGTPA